jgi:hypothetical protein
MYTPNGEVRYTPDRLPLTPKRRPAEVIRILKDSFNVPDETVEALGEAFSYAATRVVDDVVAARKNPLAFYLVRRLDSDAWWKR